MLKEERASVKTELVKLNANLRRSNSFKQSFLRGVITGLGTALGATVVAAVAIGLTIKLMQLTGTDNWLPDGLIIDVEENDV